MAEDLFRDPPELVALAGGDGTLMAALSAFHRASAGRPLPAFAILPFGTVSTIARNVGIKGRGVRYAQQALGRLAAGHGTKRLQRTLKVRDASGDERIGFIFATGLVARFFEEYDRQDKKGLGTAAKLAARLFGGAVLGTSHARHVIAPQPMELVVDGTRAPGNRFSLVATSVLEDLGLSMRLTPRARARPGKLQIVASTRDAQNLATQVPFVLAGRPLWGMGHVDVLAEALRLSFTGPLTSYVLDGDRFDVPRDGGAAPWVSVTPGPDIEIWLPS